MSKTTNKFSPEVRERVESLAECLHINEIKHLSILLMSLGETVKRSASEEAPRHPPRARKRRDHKAPEVRAWLEKHPRFNLHFA